ncbi:predicted protein, partial [Arabidopsis lyrata subsp. lyrata]
LIGYVIWELWRKKCYDESETVNWITKCHKLVEKEWWMRNLVTCICRQSFW